MDLIISFLIPRKYTFLLEFIVIMIRNSDVYNFGSQTWKELWRRSYVVEMNGNAAVYLGWQTSFCFWYVACCILGFTCFSR